jgi:type I protein arginine methyltransferase
LFRRIVVNIDVDTMQYHLDMLNDRARTSSYLAAIRKVVRPGDVVVDIGTGTGILAIAAARAGARHVYAIEAGPIARAARALFAANDLSDRITLIRGFSTRLWLPERADVLVSELIGNEPLAERVIGITKDALRRLLKPGPRLIPSGIKIFGLPVTIPENELNKLTVTPETLQNWRSWYGIEFGPLTRAAKKPWSRSLFEHFVNAYTIHGWQALSTPVLLADVDLSSWRGVHIYNSQTIIANASGHLNGVAVYFELQAGSATFLTTNPAMVDENNHWLSPVRVLDKPIATQAGDRLDISYWYGLAGSMSGCNVSRSY